MAFSVSKRQADSRAPVIAQAGQLFSQRKLRVIYLGDGRRQLLPLPAQTGREHKQLTGLPLGGHVTGPIVGAQAPIGRAHGLRVIGVTRQRPQAHRLARRVSPCLPGLVAVVLVTGIERVSHLEVLKDQRVRGKVDHVGIGVRASLVAQQAGCVGVMAHVESGLHQQATPDPVQRFLRLVKMLVGIAALAKARRIADGEAVARVHHDLRQLAPHIRAEERRFVARGSAGPRALDVAPRRTLRDRQQVGGDECLPARKQPFLAGLARSKAVAAISL